MPNEPTHALLDMLRAPPDWLINVGSWLGGMISVVVLAFMKRGESVNATIDKRMQMWFAERAEEREYFIGRIKELETEISRLLHEKEI